MGLGSFFKNIFGPTTYKAQAQEPISNYYLKDRGLQISDDDLNSIRPLLYGEISNRAPDKQQLESSVILNTALNRMKAYSNKGKNKSLSEILAMPNQYQAYGGPQYQAYFNPSDFPSQQKRKQVDSIVDTLRDQMKSGNFSDNTEGAYYYTHDKGGKIKYDNLKQLFAS